MELTLVFPITSSYTLTIERDELPENPMDLVKSLTRDEVLNGDESSSGWGDLKDAIWYSKADEISVLDEEDNELY